MAAPGDKFLQAVPLTATPDTNWRANPAKSAVTADPMGTVS